MTVSFTENRKPKTENPNIRLRIFLTGVGGQGTLLASRVLGEAALEAGFSPLVSETHGMAQRGGIVVSTVVLGEVKSPIISPGEADVLLGLGVRFDDRIVGRAKDFAPKARVIHFEIDSSVVGRTVRPEVSVMGDLALTLPALMARVRPGRLETRATSRRHTALSRELLPTLERPMNATSAAQGARRAGSVSLRRYSTVSRGWIIGISPDRPSVFLTRTDDRMSSARPYCSMCRGLLRLLDPCVIVKA